MQSSMMKNFSTSPRTRLRRLASASLAFVAVTTLVAACASSPSDPGSGSYDATFPDYYPDDYSELVEAAKAEGGELTIYSNMAAEAWAPILDGFRAKYPFATNVTTTDLDAAQVFQRLYNEESTGKPVADLLASASPPSWVDFSEGGHALEYDSPELSRLPDFAQPLPGIFTFSTDPLVVAYNTAILPEDKRPTGLASLAELVQQNPDLFKQKVTTYDATLAFGTTANMTRINAFGEQSTWDALDTILPQVRPEASGGAMLEKLQTGEYVAAYFTSSILMIPGAKKSAGLVDWSFMDDGTVLVPTATSIPKSAPHPNMAKLLVDYILSVEGQEAVLAGGFTPYREDTKAERTYFTVADEIGSDKLAIVSYSVPPQDEVTEFQTRWANALDAQ